MSDTETRMMRYTIEQLSAELQATRQYVSDIKSKLEHTRKALGIAVDGITYMRNNCLDYAADYMDYADGILEQIKEQQGVCGGKN